jgi:hypothetical protein
MEEPKPNLPVDADGLTTQRSLPQVYDEPGRLAASRMIGKVAGMTLQPTAFVHEVWIRLGGKVDRGWEGREHFFNAAFPG